MPRCVPPRRFHACFALWAAASFVWASACGTSDGALTGQIAGAPDALVDGWGQGGLLIDVAALDALPETDATCLSSDVTVVLPMTCTTTLPTWYSGQQAPKPTLALELGTYNMETGKFDPLIDGQWAPMHTGMRGGAGVWVVYRVQLPASSPDEVKLFVDGDGLIGCEPVAVTVTSMMKFVRVPGPGNYWVNATPAFPGGACVLLGLGSSKAKDVCGQFLTVHAAVGLKDKTAWGQVDRTVRLYGFRQGPVVP